MSENGLQEMSFLAHLEVLRWHIMRALAAILLCMLLAFLSKHVLFHVILFAPARTDFPTYLWLCKLGNIINVSDFCIKDMPFTLQSRNMSGQFSMHVGASLVAGFVLAFPYVMWEMWRFTAPAINWRAGISTWVIALFVSALFFTGIGFGYYILAPISIHFLGSYQLDDMIVNHFDIMSYLTTILLLILSSGLFFQLPLVVYFLARYGIVDAAFLSHHKRHALVVTLVISAIITPPDPFSQLLVAGPLMLLYFLSIFIAKAVAPRGPRDEIQKIEAHE